MHARVITNRGAKNIDDGLTFVQEKVVPVLRDQKGYRGLSVSADRGGGVLGFLGLWETEADLQASDTALADVRQEANSVIGGEMTVENFEIVVNEMAGTPPGPGAVLLLQRASMDPAKVEDNLAFFNSEVKPRIIENSGFRGLRNLINRETGQGLVGTLWDDKASMQAALERGEQRRQAARDRGISFDETSEREILFTDTP